MNGNYVWTLILFLTCLPGLLLAQSQTTDQTMQQPTEDTDTTRSTPAPALSGIAGMETELGGPSDMGMPQLPSFLGGSGARLILATEMERSNYLRAGVNVSEGYNDNAFLTPTDQVGNATFSVYPNIGIAQSTSRMRWSLGYAAGLTVNQRLTNQDSAAQSLSFDSLFALSPHVTLHAAESFSMSSGIFGGNAAAAFQPGFNGNPSILTPLANQRSNQTTVEANYHFALNDIVGASGSFSDLHYDDVAGQSNTAVPLVNTQTASATAFWLHKVFHGDWAGLDYRFQRITYDPNGETNVHAFTFADTLAISKVLHISGFVGPEYSQNQGVAATGTAAGQLTNFDQWGVAAGIEGGWQSTRMSVAGGYSKQVSSGAGVLGAVQLQTAYVAIRRQILPTWAIDVYASHAANDALTLALATTAPSIDTTSVGVMVERNVSRSLGLQIGYFHSIQDQSGATAASENYNAGENRVFVNLGYQWERALGR